MGTTSLGFEFADSTDNTNMWEHFETLAESVNDYLTTRGRIATNTRTSDSATITGTETVIDSVTAALVSGRTYKVVWTVAILGSVAASTAFVRLREDSLAGTQMQIMRVNSPATGGTGSRYAAQIETLYTAGSTGNKTFVGTLILASGTGNVVAEGDPTYPIHLYVDYVSG